MLLEYSDDRILMDLRVNEEDVYIVNHNQKIISENIKSYKYIGVVNSNGELISSYQQKEKEIIHKMMKHTKEVKQQNYILNQILKFVYEGIIVVDLNGNIMQINDVYCKVIDMPRERVIGKHVQSVIDNTNLHNTIKTGKEELGKLQVIKMNIEVVEEALKYLEENNLSAEETGEW